MQRKLLVDQRGPARGKTKNVGTRFCKRLQPKRKVLFMTREAKKLIFISLILITSNLVEANTGNGKSYIKEGVYYSDIKIPFKLEDRQVEALESGLALTFELSFLIVDSRNWRLDRDIGELSQGYSLRRNAFTGRYLVTNLNIGTEITFSSVEEVANFLSEIKNIPLVDDSILDIDKTYIVTMKANIRAKEISQWIKTISFWSEGLDTEFEEIEWNLLD